MKPFALEPSMLTLRGVFYPTGYMVVMLPTEKDARDAERALEQDGYTGEAICFLTPEEIQEKIAHSVGNADIPLPSAGTEADTARHFTQLASKGHYALMIHAPTEAQTDRAMKVLSRFPVSYGQKYRHLVIQDLVDGQDDGEE